MQLRTQAENVKSAAVAERCGYTFEATLRNACLDCISNVPSNVLMYACTSKESLPPLDVSWHHNTGKYQAEVEKYARHVSEFPYHLPKLQSTRIELRPPQSNETSILCNALQTSLAMLAPWFSWASTLPEMAKLQHYADRVANTAQDLYVQDHLCFFIWETTHNNFIGEAWLTIPQWINSSAIINFWLDIPYHGHGYASEAVASLTQYVLHYLGLNRVQMFIPEKNSRALKLAKRLGFYHEGTLVNHSKNFQTREAMNTELFSITDLNELQLIQIEE